MFAVLNCHFMFTLLVASCSRQTGCQCFMEGFTHHEGVDQKTFTQETKQKVIQCKGNENMIEPVRCAGCAWLTHWLRKQNSNSRRSEQSFGNKLY